MQDYEQPDNDAVDFTLESYEQPPNDEVDFTPVAVGTPQPARGDTLALPLDFELPLSLHLPLKPFSVSSMNVGIAVFLIGLLGLLGGAAAFLRNYVAGGVWSLAVFALLASGLFGIGLEAFWATIALTIVALIAGVIVRWMQ